MAVSEADFRQAFANINYKLEDADALKACAALVKEFGISAEELADDYECMCATRGTDTVMVTAPLLQSKAFRDVLVKQRASAGGKGAAGKAAAMPKLPFGSSWENVSEREQFVYQPTPKRQATESHNVKGGSTVGATTTPGTGTGLGLAGRPRPGVMSTPPASSMAGAGVAQLTPPGTTSKFATRTNKGQVVATLNEHLPAPAASSRAGGPKELCPLQVLGEALPPVGQHLFMMEPLETKIQAIEERMSSWCSALRAAVPGAEPESQSVNAVAQEPVWVVGRVVSDAASEGSGAATSGLALTEASLLLEGSREASEGARVRLDVSRLAAQEPGVRLFPGQVVAVRGLNPTGQVFIAQQLVSHLPAPAASTGMEEGAAKASVVVAAGPYTTSDDLAYEPLEELLQYCAGVLPDVLLLAGPFVDTEHPAVKTGCLGAGRTFASLFAELTQRLSAWQAAHPGVRVALLPSPKDAHHAPVFPTPAYALHASAEGVSSVQSPVTMAVGRGVVVGASAVDVLKAMGPVELARGVTPGTNKMAALAGHVVGQRSFFPMYPAPPGTCMDLSFASHLELPATPHVMVLPSDLAPFAKVVPAQQAPYAEAQARPQAQPATPTAAPQGQDGVAAGTPGQQQQQVAGEARVPGAPEAFVCVNPGRLARGPAGGTFAHLTVAPGEGPLTSRCRVEIRRV